MSIELIAKPAGSPCLLTGNDAIARGALEAGVKVVAGYPGTPSSEIIEHLSAVADRADIYVEWSTNEKVAMEVAAAGSFSRLRAMCVMKQNGMNVASDFLLHLSYSGIRGGMVIVSCDDPGGLSSANEGESRHFARLHEIPLLEPCTFQEAKDMTRWAFELSETIGSPVLLRSVTRMSHASGSVSLGEIPLDAPQARFSCWGDFLDRNNGAMFSTPVALKHKQLQKSVDRAAELFETSPFNTYTEGAEAELLIVTSSACYMYCKEAVHALGIGDRVGLLKLGTSWPLPSQLVAKCFEKFERILVVEEVISFLEDNLKILTADRSESLGCKTFFGKASGHLPATGEMSPDHVTSALGCILDLEIHSSDMAGYTQKSKKIFDALNLPDRAHTFCPGCPHRATYWSVRRALERDGRQGFVCGDIGCYFMGSLPCGYTTNKTGHAMGSGIAVASGFAQLFRFGMDQPVLAVCGDSTFFHAVMPGLANAVHHNADLVLLVLDNSGTAMTGFQSHTGLDRGAMGESARAIDISAVCEAMGATVTQGNPFEIHETRRTLNRLMDKKDGVQVLVLKQPCALSPQRRHSRDYHMSIDKDKCIGESCGCNRLCTRVFKCPGLIWNRKTGKADINSLLCVGCGVCASICPSGAINKKEVA